MISCSKWTAAAAISEFPFSLMGVGGRGGVGGGGSSLWEHEASPTVSSSGYCFHPNCPQEFLLPGHTAQAQHFGQDFTDSSPGRWVTLLLLGGLREARICTQGHSSASSRVEFKPRFP